MFDDDEDLNETNLGEENEKEDDIKSASENEDVKISEPEVKNSTFEKFDDKDIKEEKEKNTDTITVQPVKFASFEDLDQTQGTQNQNLNILLDVKLQLSVELGKTELPIKKVLELTKGSIITLNKAAGEPVELYANGKLIAYGEVVVIEDNFGLRITHITDPVKRLNSLSNMDN